MLRLCNGLIDLLPIINILFLQFIQPMDVI